jgi:hypothetical protein
LVPEEGISKQYMNCDVLEKSHEVFRKQFMANKP